jgi:hypothetical protein
MPSHLTSSRNPLDHLGRVTSANRQPHPLAELFPPMSEADIQELAADIKANGLENAITIFEDAILDGVNRHKAYLIAGVEPTFVPYRGDDVLSSNLHRRHLDPSQRAIIAAKMETFKHGGNRKSDQDATLQTRRRSNAAARNVSERTVASAAVVRDQGAPELVKAVEDGAIPVSTAADLAREPVEAQRQIVDSLPRDEQGKLTAEAKKIAKAITAPESGTTKARAGTDGGAIPKRSMQHQADIDRLTAKIRDLEHAGSLFDIKRDNADDVAAAIVGNITELKARKIAEAIVARLERKSRKFAELAR